MNEDISLYLTFLFMKLS